MSENHSIQTLSDIGKLSVRACNSCLRTGIKDTKSLVEYYLKKGNFFTILNIGDKTNKELIKYCKHVINPNVSRNLDSSYAVAGIGDSIIDENESETPIWVRKNGNYFSPLVGIIGTYENNLERFFNDNCTDNKTGVFPILKFLELALLQSSLINPKYGRLIIIKRGYINSIARNDVNEICLLYDLTKERIRQITHYNNAKNMIWVPIKDLLHKVINIIYSLGFRNQYSLHKDYETINVDQINEENDTDFNDEFLSIFFSIINSQYGVIYSKIKKHYYLVKRRIVSETYLNKFI